MKHPYYKFNDKLGTHTHTHTHRYMFITSIITLQYQYIHSFATDVDRMLHNTGRALLFSPTQSAVVAGPIEIHMSFNNIHLGLDELPAIVYWDSGERQSQYACNCCYDYESVYSMNNIRAMAILFWL